MRMLPLAFVSILMAGTANAAVSKTVWNQSLGTGNAGWIVSANGNCVQYDGTSDQSGACDESVSPRIAELKCDFEANAVGSCDRNRANDSLLRGVISVPTGTLPF